MTTLTPMKLPSRRCPAAEGTGHDLCDRHPQGSAGSPIMPARCVPPTGWRRPRSMRQPLPPSSGERPRAGGAALTAFRNPPVPAPTAPGHPLSRAGIPLAGQQGLGGRNPWLNPYAAETVQYIGYRSPRCTPPGFDQVLLENVRFPSSTSSKQDYGSTNGVDRAGQLAGGYCRLAGPFWTYGDASGTATPWPGDRLLQRAGRPGCPAGREKPAGEGPVLLYAG